MKTFGNLQNHMEKEMEELFIKLSHLDELEIKFNFISTENYLFYNYNDEWQFIQEKNQMYFWTDEDIIVGIENDFDLGRVETRIFLQTMIEKYFGFKNYNIK
ncbi:hypothetical protein M0Q50_02385 [bacterium]|jgi:hypothetical protein|nr:hypothetical protein [bacterium]